jgi:MFS family permease
VRRQALYLGGFLGPFGGGVLTVLIPELRDRFDTSTAAVTLAAITAYILPFAVFQLVSGTIGERLGTARTIRAAYIAYAAVSVVAAFVTSLVPFAIARAAQGTCNAFTTPLLLAALAETTAAVTLGRAMGTFAAVQTAGVVSAPLIGGLAGAVDERLAFLVPAAVALALATVPVPVAARQAHAHPPSLRSAVNRRVWWTAAAAFLAYLAVTGVGFLVSIRAADSFGLGPTERGLLLAGFGLSGVIAGRPAGDLVDRRGRVAITAAGATACAVIVPLLGIVRSPGGLAVAWLAAGVGSALIWAGLNTLAVRAAPRNRAGAVSFIGAWKFAGNAAGPAVWLPLYHVRAWLAFGVAGAASALIGGCARAADRPEG